MFSIQTSTKLTIGQTIGQAIGWFIQSLEPGDGANPHEKEAELIIVLILLIENGKSH